MDPRRVFAHIFTVEVVIAATVFALVCFAIVFAVALSHHRRRRGRPPTRLEEHRALEITFAVAVAVVAAFVVGLSFHATAQDSRPAPADAIKVRVTGFQWCWRFGYPGTRRTVTGTCDGGHDPTMVIPIGRPVTVELTSSDVIHSWWVPALRYKLDAFPDHVNRVTIKLDRAGEWVGRCAAFCGYRHSFMEFHLKAVPADQYKQWVAGATA